MRLQSWMILTEVLLASLSRAKNNFRLLQRVLLSAYPEQLEQQ